MNQRSVDVAARCIAPAVKVTQGHTGYLDLDLVPPVHLCTSGSSLSPFQPVLCRVFNFLPCDPNPFQVLVKCPTPCHPWASSSSCATCWSPRYGSSRRLTGW